MTDPSRDPIIEELPTGTSGGGATSAGQAAAIAEQRHGAGIDLPHHRLVGAEQQLLARLAACVERARYLRAAEGAVVEQAAVLAGEGHALRHHLVDDVDAHLGEAVDVALA